MAKLCARGLALVAPTSVAVSADGRNVYVAASGADAVAAFARAPKDGHLQQLQGAKACITGDDANRRCLHGRALQDVASLTLSRDGRSLYALAPNLGVAVLARNPKTGGLTQLAGTNGCVGDPNTEGECVVGAAMDDPSALAISPDGRNVYVTSASTNSLAVFARDAKSGRLTQLAGDAGCVAEPPSDPQDADPAPTCRDAVALGLPAAIAVSPDGRNVYVAGEETLAVFARSSADGSLTQLPANSGCVASPELINPDIVDAPPCAPARALGTPLAIVVSPNGRALYLASWPFISDSSETDGGVTLFAREPSGALSQAPDTAACISALGGGCRQGRGMHLDPQLVFNSVALASSPKGDTVYVATLETGAPTGTISAFGGGSGGALEQLPAQFGCVGNAADGCARGRALQGVSSVAVSPDGKNVYATAYWDDAVTEFSRMR